MYNPMQQQFNPYNPLQQPYMGYSHPEIGAGGALVLHQGLGHHNQPHMLQYGHQGMVRLFQCYTPRCFLFCFVSLLTFSRRHWGLPLLFSNLHLHRLLLLLPLPPPLLLLPPLLQGNPLSIFLLLSPLSSPDSIFPFTTIHSYTSLIFFLFFLSFPQTDKRNVTLRDGSIPRRRKAVQG